MTGEEANKTTTTTLTLTSATVALYPRIADRVDRCDRERGATLVEYGLLLILVLVVAFLSLALFGDTIVAVFETGNETLENSPANN